MHKRIRPYLMKAIVAGVAMLLMPLAFADDFPKKPVKIIVPSSPGGGIDQTARAISDKLSAAWGQAVIVENRPGANFIIGTNAAAKAPADGYTLLLTSYGAITVNPLAYRQLPYNPQQDLAPIMLVTSTPFVLMVNNDVPVKSMQELTAYLKAHPGKLNHASASASTVLVSELFKSMAGVSYQDINYAGGAQAAVSVAGGQTQMSFMDLGSATPHLGGQRMHPLALTAGPSKLRPEIPSMSQLGLSDFRVDAWIVLLAPAKTPIDVIRKINADMKKVLAQPDVVKRLAEGGNEVVASSPEEAERSLAADLVRWERLIKQRDLRFE